MKILHVITGLGSGGAEAALCRLVMADRRNVHQVVSMMDSGVYGPRLAAKGVSVQALQMPRGRATLSGAVRLYRLIRNIKPDVVQTWMYHSDLIGGVIGRLSGVKVICWGIRGPFDAARTPFSTKAVIWACARLSKWLPAAIISNSEYAMHAHVNAGYVPAKLVVIPNGYSVDDFRPDPAARQRIEREFNLPKGGLLLGMIARFDPHKDHENLFGALAALGAVAGSVTCLLVGAGVDSTNQTFVYLARQYGVEGVVRLLGPREDVSTIMAALDIHILSSAAESFPNVIAEAMACGTPCITADVGDAAKIVGTTGWVVPPSNSRALADAIVDGMRELRDPVKWGARKSAARNRIIHNYGIDQMVAQYNRVWSEHVNEQS